MLVAERRDYLVARLADDGKVVAKEVAAELGLSEDSIRRDLRDLATAGLCPCVYGGALPSSPASPYAVIGLDAVAGIVTAADADKRSIRDLRERGVELLLAP